MTEQELKALLDDFKIKISDSGLTKPPKINFFTATKMLSLEIKHSAFLAWLLGSENEHGLKNAVLKKLLAELYDYDADIGKTLSDFRTNKEILQDTRQNTEFAITDKTQIAALADDTEIKVYTEQETYNGKRIDILIDIKDKEVVIAIENKIGSTTHDNQLQEYEDFIFGSDYATYKKKIYIYLTKTGEIPYNRGGNADYNKEWCMLDYGVIRDILEEIADESENNNRPMYGQDHGERRKLIQMIGDYIDMVDKNILNTNRNARQMCKELLADNTVQQVFDMLTAYKRIPTPEQISEYVRDELGGESIGTSKAWFYIEPMKQYFIKNNENYSIAKLRCVCQNEQLPKNSTEDPRILLYVNMACDAKSSELSAAQKALLLKRGVSLTKSDGAPRKDVTLFKLDEPLVQRKERGMEFEALKKALAVRIAKFKQQLDEFVRNYL